MTEEVPRYATVRIDAADVASGFRCGKHPLDDYFKRHALKNDEAGISAAYVLRRADDDEAALPRVLGFYTLSMAVVTAEQAARAVEMKLRARVRDADDDLGLGHGGIIDCARDARGVRSRCLRLRVRRTTRREIGFHPVNATRTAMDG